MGRYIVWQPEIGQSESDGLAITARSHRDAAEEWAACRDAISNEYRIVGGQPATVMVRDASRTEIEEWIVSGEVVRNYTARISSPYA